MKTTKSFDNRLKEVKDKISYYQNNKDQFIIDCLSSDENERQYLYNDWINDFFMSSFCEDLKHEEIVEQYKINQYE